MISRFSIITDNRISYHTLEPHRDYYTLFKSHYKGSHMCRIYWVKLLRAGMWKLTGWAV